ncbi:DMT family transporter [Pacificibacter marinus]|uniref:Riboflavin transporter n=1 Tax=Pacificibacter marinus TaxID=658057 RepID=A0A1Y5SK19_9RHOB|nr:DMT family transporter [Pacificibacter marinus]SEK59196.1 EamA domain-containing membrane protein RarD [Pacificibacter marinus]SLN42466.1 Riboflavin transporter [Pacificibacter marinus]
MTDTSISKPLAGVLWMVVTTICFVLVNVTVKIIGTGLPIAQVAFMRFLLGLVFLIPMLGAVRRVRLTRAIVWLSLGRGVVHAVAMGLWFYAMTRIPMAEVTAMNFMNPVYVTLGAVVFFNEKIALPRILALGLAVIGGLVILRPGLRPIDPGHVAMIFAAVAFAGSYLCANAMSKRVPATVVVFALSTVVPLILAPFAIAVWQTPTSMQVLLIFLTAFFATVAHYCMTRAFACAPQSIVQPVSFLQLVWAMILGAALFGEGFDGFVMLGGAMIMGSVTYITMREMRAKRRAKIAS